MEKKSLEDKKTDRRNKERELQDLEEKHQVEIKVYKQSVKHLLFEHQDETTIHKTGNRIRGLLFINGAATQHYIHTALEVVSTS